MMSYEIERKGVVDKFKAWLSEQGAEVLAPTNPYELVRFRARSGVHVIYTGRRGISAGRFAEQCFAAYRKKKPFDMGITKKARTNSAKRKAALVLRDGRGCFFCIRLMSETDMTEEHLVAIGKGGTNHLDNMVLAHAKCNQAAGGLPLIEKIKIREKAIVANVAEDARAYKTTWVSKLCCTGPDLCRCCGACKDHCYDRERS